MSVMHWTNSARSRGFQSACHAGGVRLLSVTNNQVVGNRITLNTGVDLLVVFLARGGRWMGIDALLVKSGPGEILW